MAVTISIPTINTPRLTLRPFTFEDAIPLHRILSEADILQYFPRTDPPDMERVQKLIERQFLQWTEHRLGWWAVIPNGQAGLAGWNGLQYIPETGEVEVGYLLSRQFWGQGYATEGAKASMEFGFKAIKLGEIIGLTHPKNLASQNVLKKCGMKFSGQKEYFGMQCCRFYLQSRND